MIVRELAIPGVLELEAAPVRDARGSFARVYDAELLAAHGAPLPVAQVSVSVNVRRGTLRGLHLQVPPHEETKLVRCVVGAVHDVVVDLRPGPTQLAWLAVELTAERRNAVVVPSGCAHGFLTLADGCELEYLISTPYVAAAAAGVRWDDLAIGVEWPFRPIVLSTRDAGFSELDVERVRVQGASAVLGAQEAGA